MLLWLLLQKSYIMFDRASDLGVPTRTGSLDDTLDADSCENTLQGPLLITDDRGMILL